MVQKGFIAIQENPDDARSHLLKLTTKGQKTFEKVPYEIPKTFFPQVEVIFQVRRDRSMNLISNAQLITDNQDWLTYQANFESFDVAKSVLLAAASDVKVLQPVSLVSSVTKALQELANAHD